jgi:ABC-type amino acid transport substrate-binding protein
MFGDEKKADIVAYQSVSSEAKSEAELTQAIVTEAFNASGKTPVIDLLPSRQLATYALFNHDAAALIGSSQDLADQDKKQYSIVTFYLRGLDYEPVVVIFSNAQGKELRNDFVAGMQKILKSGKYLQLVEKSHDKLPPDYVGRLKRLNPGWK